MVYTKLFQRFKGLLYTIERVLCQEEFSDKF